MATTTRRPYFKTLIVIGAAAVVFGIVFGLVTSSWSCLLYVVLGAALIGIALAPVKPKE